MKSVYLFLTLSLISIFFGNTKNLNAQTDRTILANITDATANSLVVEFFDISDTKKPKCKGGKKSSCPDAKLLECECVQIEGGFYTKLDIGAQFLDSIASVNEPFIDSVNTYLSLLDSISQEILLRRYDIIRDTSMNQDVKTKNLQALDEVIFDILNKRIFYNALLKELEN